MWPPPGRHWRSPRRPATLRKPEQAPTPDFRPSQSQATHATKGHGAGTSSEAAVVDQVVDGVKLPTSPAIVAENAKTGHAWWVTTPQNAGDIEGYASQVSAVIGDTVTLFVSTKAAQFHVEAYRMGYYQGIGGRLVWQSAEVPGLRQPPPLLIPPTNTIECQWSPVADRSPSTARGRRAPTC